MRESVEAAVGWSTNRQRLETERRVPIDWPNRSASFFASAGGISWHVQRMGEGPQLLLIHGTGAATHSWRDLMPALARDFDVIAMDLPGHGFSQPAASHEMTLPHIAAALQRLLAVLEVDPEICVGHSAGAAIGIQLMKECAAQSALLVGLNPALQPYGGILTRAVANPAARLLSSIPFIPRFLSWRANAGGAMHQLIEGTGSHIDPWGLSLYRRVLSREDHVAATLAMMANWDLAGISQGLRDAAARTLFIVGSADRAVPPRQARELCGRYRSLTMVEQPELGHLAHEERPHWTADLICRFFEERRDQKS